MPQSERFDVLVLGSGTGGKLIAWHMARLGQRTAVVERQWIGGACPNIACMPSKNENSQRRGGTSDAARCGVWHDDQPGGGRHGDGAAPQERDG